MTYRPLPRIFCASAHESKVGYSFGVVVVVEVVVVVVVFTAYGEVFASNDGLDDEEEEEGYDDASGCFV